MKQLIRQHSIPKYYFEGIASLEFPLSIYKSEREGYESKLWDVVPKQLEIMEKYFGIKYRVIEGVHYKYWHLYHDGDNLGVMAKYAVVQEDCIIINNVERYRKDCNKALTEYIAWCYKNHKNPTQFLIMPSRVTYAKSFDYLSWDEEDGWLS